MTGQTQEPLQEGKSIDLYPLPEGWKWVTVSDAGAHQKNAIVDGPFGSNLKVSDYVEGGPIPVLTTKNLEGKYDDVRYITKEKFEELKRSAVYPGDILMAKIGSCGKTGIYPPNNPPAMIPANLLKVSLNDQFELKYVYYYFNSSFFQKALRTITKATAQPAFGVTNFRKLPLPYTTRDQQQLIVAEIEKQFSRLDEAVANLKRVKANLKRYKAAVLKAAVEGKLTTITSMVSPTPFGELIEGLSQGWSPKCDLARDPLPNEWAIIKTTAVQSMRYLDSESKPLPSKLAPRSNIEIKAGDFLMTRKGPRQRAGVACLVRKTRSRLMVCDTVYRFRCKESRVSPAYLELALNSPLIVSEIDRRKSGISDSGVSLTHDKLGSVLVPIPQLAEQERIVAEVDRRLSVIEELEAAVQANLTRADRLRQSVLGRAFTGGLTSKA